MRWPLLPVLCVANFALLYEVGSRYEDALSKTVHDFPDCIDELLLDGCKPWELGFYIGLFFAFILAAAINIVQFVTARWPNSVNWVPVGWCGHLVPPNTQQNHIAKFPT